MYNMPKFFNDHGHPIVSYFDNETHILDDSDSENEEITALILLNHLLIKRIICSFKLSFKFWFQFLINFTILFF